MPTEVKSQSPKNTWINTSAQNAKAGWDPAKLTIPGYEEANGNSSQPKAPQDRSEINQPKNDHSQTENMIQTLRRRLGF